MSVAVLEETKKDIHEAFHSNNIAKIEKETSYILNYLIVTMRDIFDDRLTDIKIKPVDYNHSYVSSQKNLQKLNAWLTVFDEINNPCSDFEFGKFKHNLEYWYYEIGGKQITFNYHKDYLLTPTEAAKELGVSTVTINKYIKQGLEEVDTNSHKKIPKHAIQLWKDTSYTIKVKALAQKRKLQNQSPKERISEINEELLELQLKYGVRTWQEAFGDYNIVEMEDRADYYDWQDLEDEKEMLLAKLMEDI
ncbi:helix-turn-helix domain-containing protein [Ornithinibacillus halotolerans]|nr:helix-turn-helix domain-containing protein [Ornithinibacillus halotolerans]